MKIPKVGLYAGTFNPVHEGHVALIKQAVDQLGLEAIYCLPDRLPPYKLGVVSYEHRVAMLELATDEIQNVKVVEARGDYATFPETIDELHLTSAETYILMGSDAAVTINKWRNYEQMVERTKLIIGIRTTDEVSAVEFALQSLDIGSDRYSLIQTSYADISSTDVRGGTQRLHPKIVEYIRKHRLYKV